MTKWFTVATEGQTTDGRNILAQWLQDIADTYDPKKYAARIWMEHIRSALPDSPFKAYGDVLAVRAQKNADGKLELQAQLDPTPELVAMNKARQKLYSSIELTENFANTGKAGLVGLSVTDSPASLGTTQLQFSMRDPAASPLASRKQAPENIFSSALPVDMDFSEQSDADENSGVIKRILETFRQSLQPQEAKQLTAEQLDGAFTKLSGDLQHAMANHQQSIVLLNGKVDGLAAKYVTVEEFKALSELLDNADPNRRLRPPATGGSGSIQTDC